MSGEGNGRTRRQDGKGAHAFRFIRWARASAGRCFNSRDAQVLLVLSTYADKDTGVAFPSLETIAQDCNLKVKTDAATGKNSTVSKSLARLRTAGLIESKRTPRSTHHRLLIDAESSAVEEVQSSAHAEQNYQENCHYTDVGSTTGVSGSPSEPLVDNKLPKVTSASAEYADLFPPDEEEAA